MTVNPMLPEASLVQERQPQTRASLSDTAPAFLPEPRLSGSPLSLRAHFSSSKAAALAIALVVFAMFLPVILNSYAFTDDYLLLTLADHLHPGDWIGTDLLHAAAVNGRPLQGLYLTLAFSAAGTIAHLAVIRFLGVLGIAALGLLIHWALVRSGITRTVAALIAVLMCGIPAFEIYASWTALFSAPYVAIFAGTASLIVVAAIDGPQHLVLDRAVGATAVLTAALLTYQPAAMYFWVFLAIALVGAVGVPRRAFRILRLHLGVGIVALGIAYVVVKLGSGWAGKGAPNAERNTLVSDYVGKARWFVKTALYQALNLTNLTPRLWLAVAVAALALVGITLLLLHRRIRYLLLWVIAGAALIPLCYLPNLVVRESTAYYRTQVAITSLLALYACLGAIGVWLTLRESLRPLLAERTLAIVGRFAFAVPVALVAVSSFVAARNVSTLWVQPQAAELHLLRNQIASTVPTGAPRVAFVETGWTSGIAKVERYDEFGLPSTAQPWVPESALFLILREQGRLLPDQHPIVDLYPAGTTQLPANEPHLEIQSQLLELR